MRNNLSLRWPEDIRYRKDVNDSAPCYCITFTTRKNRDHSPDWQVFAHNDKGRKSTAVMEDTETRDPNPDPRCFVRPALNKLLRRRWNIFCLSPEKGSEAKKMLLALNEWLEVPEKKLQVIVRAVNLLLTASLLIGDIEDGSLLRRRQPVTHKVFGVAQTINSANHTYFLVQQCVQQLGNPQVVEIFTEELLNLHRGQGMDLFWRETLICPTEEEYLDMISNRTGRLFRLAIRPLQAESLRTSMSLTRFLSLVGLIGLIFRIQDDFKNLWSGAYTTNKGLCEDITLGNIRSNAGNRQPQHILWQRNTDKELKECARGLIESTERDQYCRQKIILYMQAARASVKDVERELGENTQTGAVLDFLKRY
ncbi:FPP/GGPP synthase family protein [Aspergillus niger CBS 101883]|uniref:FPP/GGPP synthase family protein n=1 Tax=Aspergillus lacticoffeatus (strain CBS 101883) TaxID=1450533 RepID=UPI000D7FC49A|nr:terpenoid synthase [Aspergillus niger CBS 101883]PYH50424.1 terpenoid synthase [Aspergillus niger CBS 101883]